MRIPRIFISEKDLDKKIEELLTKKILTYNNKHNKTKLTFEVNVIMYGEDFVIEYPVDPSKNVIRNKIIVTQPKIGETGLNDLISLSESISFYHNKSTSLSAMIKEKGGQKKGVCTVYLDHSLSMDDFSKALITFYPDNVDKVKSVEAKY
jgi:hypothetical protein